MKLKIPNCPTCGQRAHCTIETVQCQAIFAPAPDGSDHFEYGGDVSGAIFWDTQETVTDEAGGLLLQCPDSHEWYSAIDEYRAQCAREAERVGYGGKSYWDYLERSSIEHRDFYLTRGDEANAERMMTQTLSDALRGNNGD